MMKNKWGYMLLGLFAALCLGSCGKRYVPRPVGYFRIDLPEATYQTFQEKGFPYRFEVSDYAQINSQQEEPYWIDILYPALNATIHCSYKPVQHNLRELSDDSRRFVFNHAGMASAIPEQGYANPEKRVYGVFYELRGNTASSYQFYLTDSTRHFFRAALYFDCIPNQDSLAPVLDYMEADLRHIIETFEWQQ